MEAVKIRGKVFPMLNIKTILQRSAWSSLTVSPAQMTVLSAVVEDVLRAVSWVVRAVLCSMSQVRSNSKEGKNDTWYPSERPWCGLV